MYIKMEMDPLHFIHLVQLRRYTCPKNFAQKKG